MGVGAGLALAPVGAAVADDGVAPDGAAEAVAVEVAGLIEVSKTAATATASGDTSEASATVIGIRGEPLSEEFGGSQKGEGEASGGLFDTGEEHKEGRVQVTPWRASVEDDGSARTSSAEAAVLRIFIDGVVSASLLQSQSTATHTDGQSSGSSSSDAADVTLFEALRVTVLHAEASSVGEGTGKAYVAKVNDTAVGTSDQLDQCAASVPGVVSVNCLQASGGAATVATGGTTDGRISFDVIDAGTDGDIATQVAGRDFGRGDDSLPATGRDARRWMATGVALVALGFATTRVAAARRRPTAA